jgi:LysM repeat protein
VDNVLKYYNAPSSQPIVVNSQPETYMPEPIVIQPQAAEEEIVEPEEAASQEHLVEVKVKKGDTLEKIAKANKTTISALRKANQLTSERLSIGQVLKIPTKETATQVAQVEQPKVEAKPEPKKEAQAAEPVYHIVKSGDSPWKIAKQYGVKYDEILRLNNMNEEKARSLKIGDRIRVK